MDVEVFDVFDLTDYTFLQISRGGVAGNSVVESFPATGVFKLRSSLVRNQSSENQESNTTLHIRSTESFLEAIGNNLIGHGVIVGDISYAIIDQTGGKNFHDGVMEHYTATLQEEEFNGS